jgi:Mg-chelatase subunit ChlD
VGLGGNGSGGVGRGAGHQADDPAQRDPRPLLAEVEGAARELARHLAPTVPRARLRADPARGELDLERTLQRDEKPFDARSAPGAGRERAWFLLVDMSGSMGASDEPASAMHGAVRTAMWLDRAAELAGIPFGVYGFDDQDEPIRIRALSALPTDESRRRVAGMEGGGGTRLAPAFEAAIRALGAAAEPAARKVLIAVIDGELDAGDGAAVKAQALALTRLGIDLLPLYLGANPAVVARTTAVFGRVLACPTLPEMAGLVRAWLRAIDA